MQSLIRILIIACLTIAGASQAKHMDEKTIDERTQPVGKVRIEGAPAAEETDRRDRGREHLARLRAILDGDD